MVACERHSVQLQSHADTHLQQDFKVQAEAALTLCDLTWMAAL